MEQQPQNQLPDYMRSPYDPRVLAENIDPAQVRKMHSTKQRGAWDHIEAALYDPGRTGEHFALAEELLTEGAAQRDNLPVRLPSEWILQMLPLFEQRSQGLDTITQAHTFEAYKRTVPLVKEALQEFRAAEGKQSPSTISEYLGFAGEGITFSLLARDGTFKPMPASAREGHSIIPNLNHDIIAIDDNGIKVGVESKAYTVDETAKMYKQRQSFGVEVFSPFTAAQKAVSVHFGTDPTHEHLTAVEKVVDYMNQEINGQLAPDSDGKAILDALSSELVRRVTTLRDSMIDENGDYKAWVPVSEKDFLDLPPTKEELIGTFAGYVASKTISAPQTIGTAKGEQTIRLSKSTRVTYNAVDIRRTETFSSKTGELSSGVEDVCGHFGVDVNDLEITTQGVHWAATIRLLKDGEPTLEAVHHTLNGATTFLSHTPQEFANLVKRLGQFDDQLTWQTPNIEEDTI